jgi:signal transduction histidine kinase
VDSTVGGGTTFTLSFPVHHATESPWTDTPY